MKLIKINGYWIMVSDSIGSRWIYYESREGWRLEELNKKSRYSISTQWYLQASQNPEHNLPSITFSYEVAKDLGIIHVEEYVENRTYFGKEESFIDGYNQALSDNKDKLFTLENMEAAACFGRVLEKFKDDKYKLSDDEEWKGFIQSLTKQEWDCSGELKGNTFLVTKIVK